MPNCSASESRVFTNQEIMLRMSRPTLLISALLGGILLAQIQKQPDDGQWTMPAKDFASTRFSTLSEVNASNVKNLKLAWTFSTGLTRGHEAAPLIVNG